MKRNRLGIQKATTSPLQGPLDDHVWPVLVAVCLAASFAGGVIIVTLQGPWMWGSLLALPVLVATTVWLIQKIPNRKLRRSLQFAAFLSLAIHLLAMIIAACSQIFPSQPTTKQVAYSPRRSERVIFVQRKAEQLPWQTAQAALPEEETLESTTPAATTTNVSSANPQPANSNSSAITSRETARREVKAESLPVLADTPSQRRTHESEGRPNTGGRLDSDATPKTSQARPTAAATDLAARSISQPASSRSPNHSEMPAPSDTGASSAAPTRKTETTRMASLEPAPAAHARLKGTTAEIASSTTARATERSASSSRPAVSESAEATSQASRSPSAQALSASLSGKPDREPVTPAEKSPSVVRREQTIAPASLAAAAPQTLPTRSRTEAATPSSPRAPESLANSAPNRSEPSAQPEISATSVTRGTNAGALASRQSNIAPDQLASSGAALQTSSAAARREATQNPELAESLTSQQAASIRRSTSSEANPSSTLATNTKSPASLRGERNPELTSAESSAANQSSSLPNTAKRLAAEQGSQALDTGTTKSIAESNPERRVTSGGGLPNLGALQFDNPRASERPASGSQPSLDADLMATAQAPKGAAQSASPDLSNSVEAPLASERNPNQNLGSQALQGEPENEGPVSAAPAFSTPRSDRRGEQKSSDLASENLELGDESQPGNNRTRLSRAPTVEAEIALGEASSTNDSSREPGARPVNEESTDEGNGSRLSESTRSGTLPDGPPTPSGTPSLAPQLNRATSREATTQLGSESTSPAPMSQGRSRTVQEIGSSTTIENSSAAVTAQGRGKEELSPRSNFESDRLGSSARQRSGEEIGPAGLGDTPDWEAGTPRRPASREALDLAWDSDSRFQRPSSAAEPGARTDAVAASEAFRGRTSPAGGGPTTEPAIELGLQFLANHQQPDGSWALENFDRDTRRTMQFRSNAAATGLALLAFQGAGYTHREFKYAVPIQRGLNWLVDHQAADGCLYVESDAESNRSARLYSHAIATLVLTEAYGMTQDPNLKKPCEKALAYIESTQDPKHGGWRYFTMPNDRRTDTSVTGWMLMALQSGRLAGFETREVTWTKIDSWLDLAQGPSQPGLYRYDPFASEAQMAQRNVSPSMTGVGLLMRLYLGWSNADPRILAGADYLLKNLPSQDTLERRDTYYWYYATQVLRHLGGERWQIWNARLHPLLIDSQIKTGELAGSWDPYQPIPDRWGKSAGRLYVTTMNLLSLEVDYRLLPLYHETLPEAPQTPRPR